MDVVCLGLMVCDIMVKPVSKDIFKKDTSRVDYFKMSSGGDALNVASNLAKLGVSSTLIGKVGNDTFGRFLIDEACAGRVEYSNVIVTNECGTSTSVVLVQPNGERNFAYYGGATDRLSIEDINLNSIKDAKILSIGSAFGLPGLDGEGIAWILKKAKEYQIETILDVTGNLEKRDMQTLKPALEYTDIFIPSYEEAERLTGSGSVEDISGELMQYVSKAVVIKMDNRGCYIHSPKEYFMLPAFNVNTLDTTGAGDSFVSGFITAYLKGWSMKECGIFANAAGAMCVQKMGATSGVGSMSEIQTFIKSFNR